MRRKVVCFSIVGNVLDNVRNSRRWERWRPNVSLCQQDDLLIDRLELLHSKGDSQLARFLKEDMQSVSPETEVNLHANDWDDPWDFEEVYGKLHDFCRAYPFEEDQEDYLVHITTGTHVAQICWFLLAESRNLPGKIIQTSPAKGRQGSVGTYSIIDLNLSRYDTLAARFHSESVSGLEYLKNGIQTRNDAFNSMISEIERVAVNSRAPILLLGPTGAGKSLLAKRIFELKQSRRLTEGGFVPVNCSTLRGDAAMSALFGHIRGAFTGAANERSGLLKKADKGVLFLDEVGDLGLDEQAMLLRALEEKSFMPMGSDNEVSSDFQLIAGTNLDLSKQVKEGKFRADLLARINIWTYKLPGLAQRKEDIEPNLSYEKIRYEKEHGRVIRFNKEAQERFLSFATSTKAKWTGNFRDLNASFVRMATLAAGKRINIDIVENEIQRLSRAWESEREDRDYLLQYMAAEEISKIDPFDRIQLNGVIEVCIGCNSLSEAGRKLYSVSRKRKKVSNDADRLKKYLERFGLSWSELTQSIHKPNRPIFALR